MINYILITLAIVALLFVLYWVFKFWSKSSNDNFFTQVKFIQMYMNDTTETSFYNKSLDEVTKIGQDLMWESASDFHKHIQNAVINKQPLELDDMRLISSAIKIIKAAEAMVVVSKHGPLLVGKDKA